MFGFGKRQEERAVAPVEYVQVLLDPAVIDRIRGSSLIDYRSWYRVIYRVYNEPEVKVARLAKSVGVSWVTAQKMIDRVKSNLVMP